MTESQKSRWAVWLKAAAIRAVRTWAQAGLAYLGTSMIGIFEVDWVGFVSVTCMSAALSLLTSLAGIPEAETPLGGDAE